MNKKLILIAAIAAFLGFVDAAYLTLSHYLGHGVACSIVEGCEQVLSSRYSVIWHVPIALFGAIYYLVVFFSLLGYFQSPRPAVLRFLTLIASTGVAIYTLLIALQIFVINALCIYCLFSALMTLVLTLSLFLIRKKQQPV